MTLARRIVDINLNHRPEREGLIGVGRVIDRGERGALMRRAGAGDRQLLRVLSRPGTSLTQPRTPHSLTKTPAVMVETR
jgi:hypothetical protein